MRFLVSSCLLLTSVGASGASANLAALCKFVDKTKPCDTQTQQEQNGVIQCFTDEGKKCDPLVKGNNIVSNTFNNLGNRVRDCWQCSAAPLGVLFALAALLI